MSTQEKNHITVLTRHVAQSLLPDQVCRALQHFHSAMRVQDPENPNLWTTQIDGWTLWAVLDEGAGPNGEDVATILFPEDY